MANRHLSRSIVLQTLFEWDFMSTKDNPKVFSKEDIEEIFSSFLVDSITMAPKILMIWRNKEGLLFEFRMKVSREFVQDLNGILKDNTPYDLIIDYPENNKESLVII